jgi:hypothetical protein
MRSNQSQLTQSQLSQAQSNVVENNVVEHNVVEHIQKTAKRIVNGWVLTILAGFIALRLASYLGVYGCLGLILLLVPAYALYKGCQPWIRYIFRGE